MNVHVRASPPVIQAAPAAGNMLSPNSASQEHKGRGASLKYNFYLHYCQDTIQLLCILCPKQVLIQLLQ